MILLCVALGLTPAVAAAETVDSAPLSATPTSITLDDAGRGTTLVSNERGVELFLEASIVDTDGAAISGATATLAADGALAPGAAAKVAVTAANRPASATLVVVASPRPGLDTGAVVRIPIRAEKEVKPSVETWTFINVHGAGDQGTRLPLTGACSSLEVKPEQRLGTVQDGGKSVSVTGSCANPEDKVLTLSVPRFKTDGREYAGTIMIGESKVSLSVKDTLSGPLTALLIALGVGLAILVGAWRGSERETVELIRKSYLVEQLVADGNPDNADRRFARAAGKQGLPDNVRDWTIASSVTEAIHEIRAVLRSSPTEGAVAEHKKALDALDLQVRTWPTTADLLGELQIRESRISTLTTYVKHIRAQTLDRVDPLDMQAMTDVRTTTAEAVNLANDWPAGSIQSACEAAHALPDNQQAVTARAALESVLARFAAAPTSDAAKNHLPAFWDADMMVRAAATAIAEKDGELLALAAVSGDGLAAAASAQDMFTPVETGDPAETASGLALQVWTLDTLVLIALLVVALVAGMQELWVGTSFGGFWDIAAAFVWGFGATTVGAPLSAAIANAGRSWSVARG